MKNYGDLNKGFCWKISNRFRVRKCKLSFGGANEIEDPEEKWNTQPVLMGLLQLCNKWEYLEYLI